jgi:hypothetical protein
VTESKTENEVSCHLAQGSSLYATFSQSFYLLLYFLSLAMPKLSSSSDHASSFKPIYQLPIAISLRCPWAPSATTATVAISHLLNDQLRQWQATLA